MQSMLKCITCGTVDDGKSTLIGHILYDAKAIYSDQEAIVQSNHTSTLNYSLLLDGLISEQEQGITIDVAYRYFTTKNRSFIFADCPGHEQYTRNMAVGAAFADVAIILVDASRGISTQTKRHVRICALMGIKHMVLAINKMDIINYDRKRFEEIGHSFNEIIKEFELISFMIIPVSAIEGDNLIKKSDNMPWYTGAPLLSYLEKLDVEEVVEKNTFLMPIQRVCRFKQNVRGFQGQIESGSICVNDKIDILPGNEQASINKIYVTDVQNNYAYKGQAVTLCLDKDVDISRGSVLMKKSCVEFAERFRATILWMGDTALRQGDNYIIKCGTIEQSANVMRLHYQIDIETGRTRETLQIKKNELVSCDIVLSQKIVFNNFKTSRSLSQFIIIDRITNQTVGCGVIESAQYHSPYICWHNADITREIRAKQMKQNPCTIWFTGLSGSGKSTIANMVERRLVSIGKHSMLLDGDNMRYGLCRDLGFSEEDRKENIRRVAEVAKLLNDAGLITLSAFISPYRRERENARCIIGVERFIEIYINTPMEICEQRDVKGLYKKARKGIIQNFTGISSPYEVPLNPNLEIDTNKMTLEESVELIMLYISKKFI